jgi:predicted DNA-binding WGR domain protein
MLYLLTAIITCRERTIMTNEIEASPLISVDENLTEELYKNIIQQCKNPEDNELVIQYNRISTEIKEKRKKNDKENEASSSRNNMTLEENSTSDILNQKGLDSINPNSERRSLLIPDLRDISSI